MKWVWLAARAFVAFGAVLWVALWAVYGGLARSLAAGCVFGALFAVAAVAVTAVRGGGHGATLSARQRVALQLPVSAMEAQRRAVAGCASLRARVVSERPGELRLRTPVSWWSWGETVTVTVRASPAGSDVLIDTRPRLRTSLGDYGQGRRLVERLAVLIAIPETVS